jgi:hypothetical protein
MKQIELAKELGVSKSYVSMILSGRRNPPCRIKAKLSSLGVVNIERGNSLRGRCPKPLDECATHLTATKCSQKSATGFLDKFITLVPQGASPRSIKSYYYTLDGFGLYCSRAFPPHRLLSSETASNLR